MATCCTVHLRVDDGNTVTLGVGEQSGVSWDSTEYIPYRTSTYPDYDGPYGVTPRLTAQTLATANRVLHADVEIGGIPSYRTTNVGGGYTVTIAQD